jgi:hypothetical protein
MKKNALEQAMKFDIHNIVPQYEELYKKVLAKVDSRNTDMNLVEADN